MAATAWPSLPGISLEVTWEPVPNVDEFPCDDGGTIVTNRGTTLERFRYNYTCLREGVAAPSPYEALDEPAALRSIILAASVTSGQFTIPNPFGGSDLTVRIEEPPQFVRDESGAAWTASVTFITDP